MENFYYPGNEQIVSFLRAARAVRSVSSIEETREMLVKVAKATFTKAGDRKVVLPDSEGLRSLGGFVPAAVRKEFTLLSALEFWKAADASFHARRAEETKRAGLRTTPRSPGKTQRDRERGALARHERNRRARAEENRARASGRSSGKKEKKA